MLNKTENGKHRKICEIHLFSEMINNTENSKQRKRYEIHLFCSRHLMICTDLYTCMVRSETKDDNLFNR